MAANFATELSKMLLLTVRVAAFYNHLTIIHCSPLRNLELVYERTYFRLPGEGK